MNIKILAGESARFKTGTLVIGIFEGTRTLSGEAGKLDKALGGNITRLIEEGELKGKPNEITMLYTMGKLPAERVLIAGLGKESEFTQDKIRKTIAGVCRYLRRKWVGDAATTLLGVRANRITPEAISQALTEGTILGTYLFRSHITRAPEEGEIDNLTILVPSRTGIPAVSRGYEKGKIMAGAAIAARDMANEPSNYKNPTTMARRALDIASSYGLTATVFDRDKMLELGMGGLLGVSQGSIQPPKFIILEYHGKDTPEYDIALVGKGITFDSGGISIKPSENMGEMKTDMSGGASVMAAIGAVAQLKPKVNVVALIPATENMPSGSAYRPGDVLTAMNGKTMEIITTDAEGRLILADALSYAAKMGVKAIIDVATLTGACVVALGHVATGAFTNNQELFDQVKKASEKTGEPLWQLPMFSEYKEQIKSDVADIKNSGGRPAGAITAAKFLEEFVGDTPWVHLDIAGTAFAEKEQGYTVKGATGVPVRTLVELVLSITTS